MSRHIKDSSTLDSEPSKKEKVVDFAEKRHERLEQKRRNYERIFFQNLVSVYSVINAEDMFPIEIIDMSEEGLSFHLPANHSKKVTLESETFPVRLYFSQDTYLEVFVRVVNARPAIEDGERYIRYGCEVDQNTQSFAAYIQFARFLRLYAEHSHRDLGAASAFYR